MGALSLVDAITASGASLAACLFAATRIYAAMKRRVIESEQDQRTLADLKETIDDHERRLRAAGL